ncbi:hypothetical protein TIFTF001_049260 [Ficus carica]|uniref:Uncharacterized protein n=1 Tax=Ficus carica TaxID=3494 RepID=A0AA87ZKQ4_FICCA|nr:hypothetical protein TIFTF001_049246 [Ficus carica]GMN25894.1 hypothetical protein TIFTF001_049248 [Ficus carica]GMN26016.1 hypothetical protein TIFTF001_049257 [Ficus carica]GMN26034.1 hypothetical protein TIFTF001_049260 [Ficus carica]
MVSRRGLNIHLGGSLLVKGKGGGGGVKGRWGSGDFESHCQWSSGEYAGGGDLVHELTGSGQGGSLVGDLGRRPARSDLPW